MGIDSNNLVVHACIVDVKKGDMLEAEFASFDEVNAIIKENPVEFEGMKTNNLIALYKLVPEGTPFGDDDYVYGERAFKWSALTEEQVQRCVDEYEQTIRGERTPACEEESAYWGGIDLPVEWE